MIPRKLRLQLMERAGNRCEMCGRGCVGEALSPHHKKHRSQGGKDTPENLIMICYSCHLLQHGARSVKS